MKIDVVKFDGTNNFEMWRCKLIDVLMASNLEDTIRLKEKTDETSEKDWDKMNRTTWSYKVLFDIRHQVSCAIRDVCNEDMRDS